MQRLVFILILIFLLGSCSHHQKNGQPKKNTNHFARGFQFEKNGDVTHLTVFNPWEKARNIKFDYYLLNKNKPVPDSLRTKKIIRTPIKRVICLSTSHLGFIDVLHENQSVVGISGANYVSNPEIQQRIKKGEAVDVGYGQNLNYEVIVNQQPDLVMVYGVGGEVTGYTQKLEELGIPVIMNAEYLEETPLGKVEWVKFMGAFFEKENEAEQYFKKVENNYISLEKLVVDKKNRPKVMVGSPYKDSWWVPGGNSYLANLIHDAGGDYLGKANPSHESYVISFENALTWGNQADVWINMGNLSSKKDILATDSRFKNFRVFTNGKIFNNNKRLSKQGGNDFWESGTVHPDLILRDLIAVFYPGLISEEMVYYQQIQ
ncbi:MAG TPA: ABC transporter substrate-binding protein [Draconibacterium sp.]|nr:ABC transporter substrate-binding protein [Draconibacterium sp.]